MVSVVLSSDLLPPHGVSDTHILMGQYSTSKGDDGSKQRVYTVFDSISCVDVDVIAEQVECLEQILPCGIVFLGLLLSNNDVKKLANMRSSLKDHSRGSSLFAVIYNGETSTRCELLMKPGTTLPLTSPKTRPLFVSLPCYLRSPLNMLPLIVRLKNKDDTNYAVIDFNSSIILGNNDLWNFTNDIFAIQLGGSIESNEDMVCVYITFAPFSSSGSDVYHAICSFLPRLKQKPHGVLVRVQSERNYAMNYQWVFTPTQKGSSILSKPQWIELKELIEDGAGETVRPFQVLSDDSNELSPIPLENTGEKDEKTFKGEKQQSVVRPVAFKPEKNENSLFKWISIVVVVCLAGAMAFIWSGQFTS
ncbi:putative protein kinase-like protein [Trypanosoma theileri]|uniref:Uncharacterized protein n=1 Tax=Trypanosoma theileri TaxID=67003 RepID=A0A1X0NLT3_9TRYP|nr:putative protein kinase-like protein [Trypanosoma theileri]ORC85675.1 putative protein kinase-like protein [Trypanosoma theileri]